MRLSDLIESRIPQYMFHGSETSNRNSIMKSGLLRGHSETAQVAAEMGDDPSGAGGVFFSTKPGRPQPGVDIWKVDVRGLSLEPDETTDQPDPEDTWWVTWWEDVEPERLELFYDGSSINESRDTIRDMNELRQRIADGSYRQNPDRSGDCYHCALRDATEHDLDFVIGTIVDPGRKKTIYHAWSVDPKTGEVFEPVAEQWFSGDLYQKIYHSRVLVQEEPLQAKIKMIRARSGIGPTVYGLPEKPLYMMQSGQTN